MSKLKEFMKNHNLKNEATSGKKLLEIANKLGLKDFNIYIRTEALTSNQGIINLTDNYKKGTHFVAFKDNFYFDSFCTQPPSIIANQLAERSPNNYCECYISNNTIQKIDEYNCGSYCLYFLYLMNQGYSFHKSVILIINDR